MYPTAQLRCFRMASSGNLCARRALCAPRAVCLTLLLFCSTFAVTDGGERCPGKPHAVILPGMPTPKSAATRKHKLMSQLPVPLHPCSLQLRRHPVDACSSLWLQRRHLRQRLHCHLPGHRRRRPCRLRQRCRPCRCGCLAQRLLQVNCLHRHGQPRGSKQASGRRLFLCGPCTAGHSSQGAHAHSGSHRGRDEQVGTRLHRTASSVPPALACVAGLGTPEVANALA